MLIPEIKAEMERYSNEIDELANRIDGNAEDAKVVAEFAQ